MATVACLTPGDREGTLSGLIGGVGGMTQDRQERAAARSTRVLILDEDRVEGGMLAFHLRREGLVVMLMTSAEEAADAIAWAQPDVLLVEVTGRGFDARELLAQLVHLPIDVFAVADRPLPAEIELDALRLGVIDVLSKPLDPVTLARRLVDRPERKLRGSVAGLPEGGISGDLGVHSAVHLLQMAHRHRLNARLHVEIEGDWAVLLVRQGEVIDAEAPSATGREAVYQVIRGGSGAFVLFPLPSDAEELSRDDVIRADLAALVADALGRKEPRAVNVLKAQEPDALVLPHIGSPRGPLAKRVGAEDTLEYSPQPGGARAVEAARVRRPGERERERHTDPNRVRALTGGKANRHATMPLTPAVPSAVELAAHRAQEARGKAPDIQSRETLRGETRRPSMVDPERTVDDDYDGFDEPTDQRPRGPAQAETQPRAPSGGERGGASPIGGLRRNTDRGLQRLAGHGGATLHDHAEAGGRRSLGEVEAIDTRARPEGARSRWGVLTLVLAGLAALLVLLIVWRLATRESAPVVDVAQDRELAFGQALIDLDEGRRDAARTALAALSSEPAATSETLAALARLHYEDGRFAEAQGLLERLAERHPRDPIVLAWLGLVQSERGDLQRATVSFDRALDPAGNSAGGGADRALAERLEKLVLAPLPAPK